jgi:hypothetical protein
MNSKKYIESEHKEYVEQVFHVNKMTLQNSEWEKKMMANGWAYVKKLDETVPTLVFASPARQAIIARENELYIRKRNAKREHDKKQIDINI